MTGVGRELSGQGNRSLYICDQSPLLCILGTFFRKSSLAPSFRYYFSFISHVLGVGCGSEVY